MLAQIDRSYKLLAHGPAATSEQINAARAYFGTIPSDYVDLVHDATEIELEHQGGQYLRVWGPSGCIEMSEGYGIRQYLADAVPIGDDGGGRIVFYAHGRQGEGLYHVGYGNLDRNDAIWIAISLNNLLLKAEGIDSF